MNDREKLLLISGMLLNLSSALISIRAMVVSLSSGDKSNYDADFQNSVEKIDEFHKRLDEMLNTL